MSGIVFEFLQIATYFKTGPCLRVASISEGKGKIFVCGTRDYLDTFPQLIVNSLSTILHSIVYAIALHLSCYTNLAVASCAVHFSSDNC